MDLNAVLDTCVVVDLLSGGEIPHLPTGRYAVSVVTELELLSKPAMTPDEESQVRDFLRAVLVVGLLPEVRARTVDFRRRHGLKLPDAIIAGTASACRTRLLTVDRKLLAALPEIATHP